MVRARRPNTINNAVQANVSLERIKSLLVADVLEDDGELQPAVKGQTCIRVEKAHYAWNSAGDVILKNFEFEVLAGQLVTIVGSTGSGKSSVLSAILGEMMPPVNVPMPSVRGKPYTVAGYSAILFIVFSTLLDQHGRAFCFYRAWS